MPTLPQDVRAVIGASFLARVPQGDVEALLASGYRIEQEPGRPMRTARDEPSFALVIDGLVRVFLESQAGRQVTVRYARPGEALGLVHLLASATEVKLAAVTHTELWVVPGAALLTTMERAPGVAAAVARECAARAADAMGELGLAAFGSVRARLARHLLDLAAALPGSGELVAAVTQQQLADAVGSVREVIARTLGELRTAGLVGGGDTGIVILDAGALYDLAARG